MPGKQARVLCPVCQEPIPPDETECGNCGAFVIDEAVVRLSRAFGLDRERALKLFDAGFRHPKQLRDRDPNRVLEKGEVGLLFICTNCGGFVAAGDSKCPRCAAEFETEEEGPAPEETDILDLVLCPVCGADNDPELAECEICGEALREGPISKPIETAGPAPPLPSKKLPEREKALDKVDDFLQETERPAPLSARRPERVEPPAVVPRPVPRTPTPPPISPTRVPPATAKSFPSPREGQRSPADSGVRPMEPGRMRTARPEPREARPSPTIALETRMEPRRVNPPSNSSPRPAPPARTAAARNEVVRKKVRTALPANAGLPAETVGGLVLAASASLLLAGRLDQPLVSAGIAMVLAGLVIYQIIAFLHAKIPRPGLLEALLLGAGSLCGLAALGFRGNPANIVIGIGAAAAFPFAWATRQLLRTPQRVLLAVASAIPMIGHGLAAAFDGSYQLALPEILGILAVTPWPAALAATEILRRQSVTVLRRQLVRAERNVQEKNYERSLTEYDRAIAGAPTDVPGAEIPWYGKGATLILLGRYEEALRAIDTALDINPQNEVAWVNKGNALTRLGQLIDALRCFNAAIKVNPRFEVAWNNKGNALARLGKFEEALRCYDRALDIDPGYRGAWVNKGFVLTKLGRFDEAASCADHALVLDRRGNAEPA
jgi:tetratricopeptide (TPR) repeat protein